MAHHLQSLCPKCAFVGNTPFTECPQCGIIISKFIEKQHKEAQKQDHINKINQSHELAGLTESRELFVRQQMESAEVWFGFETRNRSPS